MVPHNAYTTIKITVDTLASHKVTYNTIKASLCRATPQLLLDAT